MKAVKKRVSLTVDEKTIEEIRVLAKNADRSLSQYIHLLLKDYLRKQSDDLNSK